MQIRAQNAMSDAEQSYDRFKAPIMLQLAYILRIVCTLLQNVHWKGQKGVKCSQICSCCPCLLDWILDTIYRNLRYSTVRKPSVEWTI